MLENYALEDDPLAAFKRRRSQLEEVRGTRGAVRKAWRCVDVEGKRGVSCSAWGDRRSSSAWLRWHRARSLRGCSWAPWPAASGHVPSSSDGPRCCHRITGTLSSRLLHAWTRWWSRRRV